MRVVNERTNGLERTWTRHRRATVVESLRASPKALRLGMSQLLELGTRRAPTYGVLQTMKRATLKGVSVACLATLGLLFGTTQARAAECPPPPEGCRIFWTDIAAGAIQCGDCDSRRTIIDSDFADGECIAVDSENCKIYWADPVFGWIQRANYDGSARETVLDGLDGPRCVALDVPNNKLYWTETGAGAVRCATLDGEDVRDICTGLSNPFILEIDLVNRKLYWSETNAGKIHSAMLDEEHDCSVFLSGLTTPWGVAVDPMGNTICWVEHTVGRVKCADLDGSNVRECTSGFGTGREIDFDLEQDQIYWTTDSGKIQRIGMDCSGEPEDCLTELALPSGIAILPPQGCNGNEIINKAKCKTKRGKVKRVIVKMKKGRPFTKYTAKLDGGQTECRNTNKKGKATFKFKDDLPECGDNRVTVSSANGEECASKTFKCKRC